MKRSLLTLLAAACLAATFTASASAKSGLFGVVVTPQVAAEPASVLDSQMGLMVRNGVQSVRVNFDWSATEPVQGHYNFAEEDTLVALAAKHHLSLLPIVEFTPYWASSHRSDAWTEYAPTSPRLIASFMTALVKRYGPHGTFWATHHPYGPVRSWQIWNEPEGTTYDWRSQPWYKTYPPFLKAAYVAVHRADRGAKVLTGALVALNCQNCTPWAEARLFYKAGFKRYFDVVAVNDFTLASTVAGTVNYNLEIIRRVRNVMRAYHDGAKPIWITELTWTAALGRIPPSDYYGFETTASGQAARLTAFYKRIATQHPYGIQRAYWYTWASPYSPAPEFPGADITFQYSGLLKWTVGASVFQPLPLLGAYAKVAHRYANR